VSPVSLGMPAAPLPVLSPRRKTRQIRVGSVGVGSDSPVSVQSMTTTPTTDINVLGLEVDVRDHRDRGLHGDDRQRVGVVLGRAGHAHDVTAGGVEPECV
jgi:hypothetical protein